MKLKLECTVSDCAFQFYSQKYYRLILNIEHWTQRKTR